MRSDRLPVLFFLLVLLLAACSPATTSTPAAELPATAPPTVEPPAASPVPQSVDTEPAPVSGNYPLDTVTHIEEIDIILAAVASQDPQQVRDLFGYTTTACTNAEGLGGPPQCRVAESEGTLVEALPFLGPEGSFLRRDEAGNFPGLQVSAIHAIYEVSEIAYTEEYYPAGEYAIAFVSEGDIPGVILHVQDASIIRIDFIFHRTTFDEIFGRDAAGYILPPKS